VRRVKVTAAKISADPRSRRRRTIPAGQLALALDGHAEHAWACSFIVTNIPADDGPDIVGLEAWFRRRTSIEDRFRDGKHGSGLNHLRALLGQQRLAGLRHHRLQPHPRRRHPGLYLPRAGDDRDDPRAADHRPGPARPLGPPADPASTDRLALAERMAATRHRGEQPPAGGLT